MNIKRFRVAFSFAGEKRDCVAKVAEILSQRFGKDRILYDKYHESEFARHDLGIYLPKLYSEESDLIVPVLCPKYDEKHWTGWEWIHIHALLTKSDGNRVMPCRFGFASADGLTLNCGFIELDDKSPEEFATRILERLAINEGKDKTTYLKLASPCSSLPGDFPELAWFFTGRDLRISEIRDSFARISNMRKSLCMQVIHGIGGVGKTQLAIAYARQLAGEYELVAFLHAEKSITLNTGYLSLSDRLGINLKIVADDTAKRELIRNELKSRGKWLLIFDNAKKFEEINDYIPTDSDGHLLITTQNRDFGGNVAFLRELKALDNFAAADLVKTAYPGAKVEEVEMLLGELGNLPLALAQAAAYCNKTRSTISQYVNLLKEHPLAILKEKKAEYARYSVDRTWRLALDRIMKSNIAALQFLKVCSFLGPEDIPLDVLVPARMKGSLNRDWQSQASSIPEPLRSCLVDKFKFGEIIETLGEFSLADINESRQGLSMHRLLQLVVRETAFDGFEIGPRTSIELITAAGFQIQFARTKGVLREADIVPHAIAAIEHAWRRNQARPAEVFFLAGRRDMECNFHEAETLARSILETAEQHDVLARVSTTVRLAAILDHQKRSADAVKMLQALRADWEKLGDSEQADAVLKDRYWWGLYQLGVNLRQIGRYAEAQQVLRQVHDAGIRDKRLSAHHQLGVIDLLLGELDSAKTKFVECLEERGSAETDHRRAFEHRRLGQISALRHEFQNAMIQFREAIRISKDKSPRYVDEVATDIKTFVEIPEELLADTRPSRIDLKALARQKNVLVERLFDSFRVLTKARRGFLTEVDSATGNPTGILVDYNETHKGGIWHETIAVAIFDSSGKVAIQRRGEVQSRGRWDISVAGHMEIGEQSTDAAVRETFEEVGILVSSDRLEPVGEETFFSKQGSPDIEEDHHTSPTAFRYFSSQRNSERVFVLRLKLNDRERLSSRTDGALEIRWLTLPELVKECAESPRRFASSIKHLFCHRNSLDLWL